jgi:3-dehydroquinate dehydratase
VPYTPNTEKTGHVKLMTKISQIEKLVCNHSTKMGVSDTTAQFKREKMFIDILESIDEKEAEVLIAAKDKIIHRKYVISDNVVREAFGWTKDYVREPEKGGSKTWAP